MNAIVALLGGWRATVFLAAALLMAAVSLALRFKVESLERAALEHAAADTQMQLWALDNAREAEYQHRLKVGEITGRLSRENEDARKDFDARLAAVRAGTVRVRDDRKCPARDAEAGGATAGSDGPEGAYLPAEAVERVLRIGREADDAVRQLAACQAVIRADREAIKMTGMGNG